MNLEQKNNFRTSDDNARYINIQTEEILDKMRKKNTLLSKKIVNLGYCIKLSPIIAFFILFPFGALMSSILQMPIEDTFYIVAPIIALMLYATLKKLTQAQQRLMNSISKEMEYAVAETEKIAYGRKTMNEPNAHSEKK